MFIVKTKQQITISLHLKNKGLVILRNAFIIKLKSKLKRKYSCIWRINLLTW